MRDGEIKSLTRAGHVQLKKKTAQRASLSDLQGAFQTMNFADDRHVAASSSAVHR